MPLAHGGPAVRERPGRDRARCAARVRRVRSCARWGSGERLDGTVAILAPAGRRSARPLRAGPLRARRRGRGHGPRCGPARGGVRRLTRTTGRVCGESHARAVLAPHAGGFDAEIVPVDGVAADERPRAGLTAERLARFPAAFRGGRDGDGRELLRDQRRRRSGRDRRRRLLTGGRRPPGLRVLATATVGVAPDRPVIGLVPAVQTALAGRGCVDGPRRDRVQRGVRRPGARVLRRAGHRPGAGSASGRRARRWATPGARRGAVLVVRLFTQLVRADRGRYGLAAIAAGGGQGDALVVEACR